MEFNTKKNIYIHKVWSSRYQLCYVVGVSSEDFGLFFFFSSLISALKKRGFCSSRCRKWLLGAIPSLRLVMKESEATKARTGKCHSSLPKGELCMWFWCLVCFLVWFGFVCLVLFVEGNIQ